MGGILGIPIGFAHIISSFTELISFIIFMKEYQSGGPTVEFNGRIFVIVFKNVGNLSKTIFDYDLFLFVCTSTQILLTQEEKVVKSSF